jgi:hypothetical protein
VIANTQLRSGIPSSRKKVKQAEVAEDEDKEKIASIRQLGKTAIALIHKTYYLILVLFLPVLAAFPLLLFAAFSLK